QRFFNQQFVGGREVQTALADLFELFGVVGNATAGAAQREAWADHHGKARAADVKLDALLHRPGFFQRVGNARPGGIQADAGHRVLELQTVFGLLDGVLVGSDHLDLVLVQHAVLVQIKGAVQRGLTAHGGQDGVRAFLGDDLLDDLPSDGFDVGDVGRTGIGHDGRRIAVDQDDLVALFTQGLAGLSAGVVEFAGLTNDDRARANDEDALDVLTLRHSFAPLGAGS